MTDVLHLVERIALLTFFLSSMLALGMGLSLSAVMTELRDARTIAIALVLNFGFAPLLVWLLAATLPIDRSYETGLLLLGGAAGAPFIPKLANTARGNPALAAALTVILCAGTIIFLPLVMPAMIPGLKVDAWSIARPLLLFMALPFAVGLIFRTLFPALAVRLFAPLALAGSVSLLVLFGVLVVLNWTALRDMLGSGAVAVASGYMIALFVVGWLIGGPSPATRGVMGLAASSRNFGAALIPATASLGDPKITTMLVACAVACLLIGTIAARWARARTPGSDNR